MPKVYISNRGGHNHSEAEKFGELIYLTEGLVSRYAITRMYREAAYALCESKPEDYILVSGLSAFVGIVAAIFGMMHRRINYLIYKPSSQPGERSKYLERVIFLDELIKKGDKNGASSRGQVQ